MEMEDGPVLLNIGNICGGAVPEIFEHEIGRLMANIDDLNTDPEAKRTLTLEFKFAPAPDRKSSVVTVICKTKLAGINAVAGSVFMSKLKGTVQAYTEDPRQAKLFAQTETVTPKPQ